MIIPKMMINYLKNIFKYLIRNIDMTKKMKKEDIFYKF